MQTAIYDATFYTLTGLTFPSTDIPLLDRVLEVVQLETFASCDVEYTLNLCGALFANFLHTSSTEVLNCVLEKEYMIGFTMVLTVGKISTKVK